MTLLRYTLLQPLYWTKSTNMLMIQDVLKDDYRLKQLTTEDYRGLTPLFYGYVEPYGTLKLDMTQRLALT